MIDNYQSKKTAAKISMFHWSNQHIVDWTQIILDSYSRLLGKELIDRSGTPLVQSQLLYTAPLVVVSHGTQADPILNYGNQVALDLWEMTWEQLTQTPSRLTAEPENREIRQQMLAQVKNQGFINNYAGVRISQHGRRFQIDRAIIWNLLDTNNLPCGQAATFQQWRFLE